MSASGTDGFGYVNAHLEQRRAQIEQVILRRDFSSAAYLLPDLLAAARAGGAPPNFIQQLERLGIQIQNGLQGKTGPNYLTTIHPVVEVRLFPDRLSQGAHTAIPFTLDFLSRVVYPYLSAAQALQETHDALRARPPAAPFRIVIIQQDSPLRVKLQGAFDALRLIDAVINPLRAQANQRIADLAARERRQRKRAQELDPVRQAPECALLEKAYHETSAELGRITVSWTTQAITYIEPELNTQEKQQWIQRLQPAVRTLAMGDFVFHIV